MVVLEVELKGFTVVPVARAKVNGIHPLGIMNVIHFMAIHPLVFKRFNLGDGQTDTPYKTSLESGRRHAKNEKRRKRKRNLKSDI